MGGVGFSQERACLVGLRTRCRDVSTCLARQSRQRIPGALGCRRRMKTLPQIPELSKASGTRPPPAGHPAAAVPPVPASPRGPLFSRPRARRPNPQPRAAPAPRPAACPVLRQRPPRRPRPPPQVAPRCLRGSRDRGHSAVPKAVHGTCSPEAPRRAFSPGGLSPARPRHNGPHLHVLSGGSPQAKCLLGVRATLQVAGGAPWGNTAMRIAAGGPPRPAPQHRSQRKKARAPLSHAPPAAGRRPGAARRGGRPTRPARRQGGAQAQALPGRARPAPARRQRGPRPAGPSSRAGVAAAAGGGRAQRRLPQRRRDHTRRDAPRARAGVLCQ